MPCQKIGDKLPVESYGDIGPIGDSLTEFSGLIITNYAGDAHSNKMT